MKKTISTFLMISIIALFVPLMPAPTAAATLPVLGAAVVFTDFKPCPSGTHRVRRNTRTGKKVLHSLIAGGIGAAIGGGIGGKRGALIGGGSGAGGYLVYRYVKDKKGRCVAHYVRG